MFCESEISWNLTPSLQGRKSVLQGASNPNEYCVKLICRIQTCEGVIIYKQLLDEVFVISRTIKVEVVTSEELAGKNKTKDSEGMFSALCKCPLFGQQCQGVASRRKSPFIFSW